MNTQVSSLADASATAITLNSKWMILMSPAHHFIRVFAKNVVHRFLAAFLSPEAFGFSFILTTNSPSVVPGKSN